MKATKVCPDVAFCLKCKHLKVHGCDPYVYEICNAIILYSFDHRHCWKTFAKPEVKNKNNDCLDFKLRWWRKLFNLP